MSAIPNLFHVDVFATRPLSGNGLAVFMDTDGWPTSTMQRLAPEMKHFESIYLSEIGPGRASARVFTVEEELPFAGHPVLGAAVVLHRTQTPEAIEGSWVLKLASGDVAVSTTRVGSSHMAEMNQGVAAFGKAVDAADLMPILARLGLCAQDLVPGLPAQVVSTGLPYLVVPLRPESMPQAKIRGTDLEALLVRVGGKFVVVLDVAGREIRTWDNLGRVEDVATGSAAGPAAAYLFGQGQADACLPIELKQGRFAGRPSKLHVRRGSAGELLVSGAVWPVSHGYLDPLAMNASE